MLIALNKIGSEKALPITDTIKKTKMLMEYAATKLDAIIRFHPSDICIHIDSTQNMVARYIYTRTIQYIYLEAVKRLGEQLDKRWWGQEVMSLADARADAETGGTRETDD